MAPDGSPSGDRGERPTATRPASEAQPRLLTAFREQIAEALPKTDLQIVDSLEGYALATLHAHALWLAAAAPPGDLVKLNDEALALRDQLYGDATTLSRHALLDAGRLAQLKVAIGYKNVALDLISLAALLREARPRIQGKSAVELSALDTAETLADRIITAVSARACQ